MIKTVRLSLTTSNLFQVILGEFNFSATIVNSELAYYFALFIVLRVGKVELADFLASSPPSGR